VNGSLNATDAIIVKQMDEGPFTIGTSLLVPYVQIVPLSRIQYIEHKGRKVLLFDLANGKAADILDVVARGIPIVRNSEPNSLLTLTDVTNLAVQDVAKTELMKFVADNKPYVKAAAVVGVSDLAKAMLSTTRLLTGRNIVSFRTRDEALNWLVSLPMRP
jgi:hypothetical protein